MDVSGIYCLLDMAPVLCCPILCVSLLRMPTTNTNGFLIEQFALLETYYIVARLLQEFVTIESRDESEWEELSALAMTCKNGVRVSLQPAND